MIYRTSFIAFTLLSAAGMREAVAQTAPGEAVLSENFDNMDINNTPWSAMKKRSQKGVLKEYFMPSDCGPDGSACLRVSFVPDEKGTSSIRLQLPLPPATEYTMEYDVLLEEGWEHVRGGKMHGLAPKNVIVGCDAREPDGWSVRVMWEPNDGKFYSYPYHQVTKKGKNCGDRTPTTGPDMEAERWYRVSVYVKVNTPGQSDGTSEIYLDGNKISESPGVAFRGNVGENEALIETFLFNTYYGGNRPIFSPSKTTYARFDNFVVRRGLSVTPPGGGDAPAAAPPPAEPPEEPAVEDGVTGGGVTAPPPPQMTPVPPPAAAAPEDSCVCPNNT